VLDGIVAYDVDRTAIPRASRPHNGFPHHLGDNGVDLVDPADRVEIDFLYGVFDGALVDRRDGDLVITVMSHPVQHVYDLYQYLAHVNRTTEGPERRSEGVWIFDDLVAAGIEHFVDRFLAGDRELVVHGHRFELVEDFFRFNDEVPYDLVGIEEEVGDLVGRLADRLGRPITPSARLLAPRSSIETDCRYRYDDLCRALAGPLDRYEALRASG
jgi:hypothetical protein